MSSQRYYLEKPAVRVQLTRVRFPKICPVCGAPGTILSRITLTSRESRYLNRSWDPYYSPYSRVRQKLPDPKLRVLPIYVCEKHHHSDDGTDRYQSCCFITDGFALAFFFFGLLFVGDAFYRGRPVPFWSVIFAAFFALSLFLTWIAFRPNAIQRAVQVVGFDPGMQNILLIFEKEFYRDAVIHDNPMTTELVSWIVRHD